ncbi:unnamed protein product [Prunus brigantina]
MGSNMQLVWPESKAYASRVNNCSHTNSCSHPKLMEEQLEKFKKSCFGHLVNIDKIQFNGQIGHGIVLRRVSGRGVKDLDRMQHYSIHSSGFLFDHWAPFWGSVEISSGDSDEIKLKEIYFLDEGITCFDLEEAFLRCKEGDDIYKLALVYFAEFVVLEKDKHLNINVNYLTLVEDLDAFNSYP